MARPQFHVGTARIDVAFWRSLPFKASIFVGAIVALAGMAMAAANVGQARAERLMLHVERSLSFSRMAADMAVQPLRDLDVLAAEVLLEGLAREPEVLSLQLVDPRSRLLADGDRAQSSSFSALDDPLIARAIETGQAQVVRDDVRLIIAQPLSLNRQTLGALRTEFSLAAVGRATRSQIGKSALLLLLALGIALPLTGLMLSRASQPLRQLTQAAEAVAQRNFDLRLDVRTGDELQVLATAFNEMIGHIKSSLDRARWLAYVDQLTRLPNKTAFFEQLRRTIGDAETPGAVLLIDLDRFKRLNDIYGDAEGDRILVTAAERLRGIAKSLAMRYDHRSARPPYLARLAGDEFVLSICGPAIDGVAKHTAMAILDALKEPIKLTGAEVILSGSIGIARFPGDAADCEHLVRHANLALDAAKDEGGGVYRFFEPEMTRRAVERITIENELRQAIANQEFVVYYQPKVDARTGATTGCEALVRWMRKGKLVGPALFIEAAEESGLIVDIGDFVLAESCRAAARWRDAGLEAHVAVNVSNLQFQSETFGRSVVKALRDTGLPPELLELEITESTAMGDVNRLLAQIEPLRAKGVRFAIDDFGTGYSSLGSLTKLPFDTFKIDQSFVRNMDGDPNARVVIETILAMARALGYDTVAEGVETETHFAFLRLNGCTYAQGWHFGKPMPEEAFVEHLSAQRRPRPPESVRLAG